MSANCRHGGQYGDCPYCAEDDAKDQRIAELEAQLASLSWTPITEDNLPKVGDEILTEDGRVHSIAASELKWKSGGKTKHMTADIWRNNYFTHRRPINAPPHAGAEAL